MSDRRKGKPFTHLGARVDHEWSGRIPAYADGNGEAWTQAPWYTRMMDGCSTAVLLVFLAIMSVAVVALVYGLLAFNGLDDKVNKDDLPVTFAQARVDTTAQTACLVSRVTSLGYKVPGLTHSGAGITESSIKRYFFQNVVEPTHVGLANNDTALDSGRPIAEWASSSGAVYSSASLIGTINVTDDCTGVKWYAYASTICGENLTLVRIMALQDPSNDAGCHFAGAEDVDVYITKNDAKRHEEYMFDVVKMQTGNLFGLDHKVTDHFPDALAAATTADMGHSDVVGASSFFGHNLFSASFIKHSNAAASHDDHNLHPVSANTFSHFSFYVKWSSSSSPTRYSGKIGF